MTPHPESQMLKDIAFLREAAGFFEHADAMGEDRAFWANIYNAEACRRIADRLSAIHSQEAAPSAVAWALRHKSDGNVWLYSAQHRAAADQRPCHDLVPLFASPAPVAVAPVGVSEAEIKAFRAKYKQMFPGSMPDRQTAVELLEAARDAAKAGSDAFRDILSSIIPAAKTAMGPTHRHVKRGSTYVLIGIGKMQTENWQAPNPGGVLSFSADMEEVAVYRSTDDGSLWVRPRAEFEDGRFAALSGGIETPKPEGAK